MDSKQLGLSEYNDIILSLYDANPIASIGSSVKKAPEPENKKDEPESKKVGTTSLLKETYKMKLAAIANLKLTKRMFEYEKQRFKQLKVSLGKLSKDDEKETKLRAKSKDNLKKDGKSFNWGKWIKSLFGRLLRKLKIGIKRKIPKKYRVKWKNLKRNIRVRTQRIWRNFTKPFRQLQRAAKNLPGRLSRGTSNLFTQSGRSGSLGRANNSYQKFIKGTANAGDKLRLIQRGLITPSQALTKGGPEALKVPITPNIFRDSFDALGKPIQSARSGITQGATAIGDTFQTGKENVVKGVTSATDFFGGQFNKLKDLVVKKGDEALKGGNQFMNDAVKFGSKVVGKITKWGQILSDPQTYVKIKNSVVSGVNNLKGAAKQLFDQFVASIAQHPWFKNAVESRVGKKVFGKLGKKALGKILGRVLIGVGTVLAIWEAIEDWAAGDYEGAALALFSAIPLWGIIPAVIDILKELFPESWESVVSQITGKTEAERNESIKSGTDLTTGAVAEQYGTPTIGAGLGNAFAEGGLVPAKPQLVLVGEGGEEEFIVPKSKLNYFLGSDSALEVMNAGASAVFSASSEYLKSAGLMSEAAGFIPELSLLKTFGTIPVAKSGAKQHQKLSVGDAIKNKIVEVFKDIWDKIKSFIPNIPSGLIDGARRVGESLINAVIPGASAATLPPSALGDQNLNFGAVSGTSGSVAYGGREQSRLSVAYSPFKASDIKSKGINIISGKGYRKSTKSNHKGYDLPAPQGTPLYAYLPGKVTLSRWVSGYGYAVEWKDSIHNQTHFFAHMMAQSPLKVGQEFQQGALLGKTGDTGTPGSYHLHWEIGGRGSEIDPGQWVNSHPLPPKGPADPLPLNKDKPNVTPTPEPDPNNLLNLFAANRGSTPTQQQPQIIPMPMPNSTPTFGGMTTPQYSSWGLGIQGN